MRLWDPTREYEVLHFEKDHFIRVVLPLPGRRIYIAAALDMKFKIYDANLLLVGQFAGVNPISASAPSASRNKSSQHAKKKQQRQKKNSQDRHKKNQKYRTHETSKMDNKGEDTESIRAVLCMHYDAQHDEIITGGLSGCQRWRLSGDRFHKFVFTQLQTLPHSQGHWIDHVCLANNVKLLFCCHGDSVTVYQYDYLEGQKGGSNGSSSSSSSNNNNNNNAGNSNSNMNGPGRNNNNNNNSHGTNNNGNSGGNTNNSNSSTSNKRKRKRSYRLLTTLSGIHDHSITGCLYNDANGYLVTSSLDLAVKVWSAASSYSLVHTFNGHSKSVTGLLMHPYPSLIVSCSLDCTLRVWNLETLEEEYHLETTEPVLGMELGNLSNNILVRTSKKVISWHLHHIVTLFAVCRSPVVHLAYIPPALPLPSSVAVPAATAAPALVPPSVPPSVLDTPATVVASASVAAATSAPTQLNATTSTFVPVPPLTSPSLNNGKDNDYQQHRQNGTIVARSRDHSVRVLTVAGECVCTLLPDSAVTVMTKVLYAPETHHLLGLLGPTGDVFAYTTTNGPMALLAWKVGAKVRINHDKVNDIALCQLTLNPYPNNPNNPNNNPTSNPDNSSMPKEVKTYLVGATAKGYLYAWHIDDSSQDDPQNESRLVQPPSPVHKDSILTIVYSQSSSNIICFIPSAGLLVVDQCLVPLRTLTMENTPFYINRKMTPTTCVQLSRDTALVLMGLDNGSFQMFDTVADSFKRNQKNNKASFEHDAAVTSASFYVLNDGGILVATGGRDGCLKFWDVKKQLLCELPLTAALHSLCFLPNGDIIFGERQHVARVKASTYGLHTMIKEGNLLQKQVLLEQETDQEGDGEGEASSDKVNRSRASSSASHSVENSIEHVTERDQYLVDPVDGEMDEFDMTSTAVQEMHYEEEDEEEQQQQQQLGTSYQTRTATRPSEPKSKRTPFRATKLLTALSHGVGHPKGLPVGKSKYRDMIDSIPPPIGNSTGGNDGVPWKHSMSHAKADNDVIRKQQQNQLHAKRITFVPTTRKKMKSTCKTGFKNQLPTTGASSNSNGGNRAMSGPEFQAVRSNAFLPAFLPFTRLPSSLRRGNR